jgi:hypothetical protein
MVEVGDIGSIVVVAEDVVGRWKRSPKFGHIALSILVAPSTFDLSSSKCILDARRTRASNSRRQQYDDDDDDGCGPSSSSSSSSSTRPSTAGFAAEQEEEEEEEEEERWWRLSIAHSTDAYETTLGL